MSRTFNLDTQYLTFYLRLPEGEWDWHAKPWPGPHLERARMAIHWRSGQRRRKWSGEMDGVRATGPETVETTHGRGERLYLAWRAGPGELSAEMEVLALTETPLLLWRVRVENVGEKPIRLEGIEMLRVGPGKRPRFGGLSRLWAPMGTRLAQAAEGALRPSPSAGELAFFTNGWQSWSFAGALGPSDRFPRTRLGPLAQPLRVNAGTPQPARRGHFASDMFGILGDRGDRTGLLIGFISQQQAFGSIETKLNPLAPFLRMWANTDDVRLEPGSAFVTDWACLQAVHLDEELPIAPYSQAVARENGARTDGQTLVGWCSWYQYFDKVSQEDVIENLEWAASHRGSFPLQIIQVDDGFEAEVGDWLETNGRFPDGMQALAARIRQAGFRPGIWLAPFVAKPKARLIREHPDWVLRNWLGRSVNAGYIWGTFARALDVTNPEVLRYAREVVRQATRAWGYDYLKLDFLYAGALPGVRWDPTLTRAQALRRALVALREAAGDRVTMLGCGCPLGSGIGIFDGMRIGADVAPRWQPAYGNVEFPFRPEPDFPSVRNAVRNVITRAWMHGDWWVNDPDCLLVREQDTYLTEAEVQTLATAIALSAGSLFVSDRLRALPERRREWLQRLLPPLPRAARPVDWFDRAYPEQLVLPLSGAAGEWHLVALLNWADQPRTLEADLGRLGLPEARAYHAVDFWNERYHLIEGTKLRCDDVPPHGVRLLSVRPAVDQPLWLGDTLHVSQGLHVTAWKGTFEGPGLKVGLDLAREASGDAWLALPADPMRVQFDGREVAWRREGHGVYRLRLEISGKGELEIHGS